MTCILAETFHKCIEQQHHSESRNSHRVELAHLAVGVDVLAHVVILGQVEQLADLGGALRAPQARLLLVCQSRQLLLACWGRMRTARRQVC